MSWLSDLFHTHQSDKSRITFEYVVLDNGDVDRSKRILTAPCRGCGVIERQLWIVTGPNRWISATPVWEVRTPMEASAA